MRTCRESQLIERRVAPRENYARSFSKSVRDPMRLQDHEFGRITRYFESERFHDFGGGTWLDDSKVQFIVLCRNRNVIPVPLSRLEGLVRSQPGVAAMRSACDMSVPPSARYVALANVAKLDSSHCRASIVYQRVLNRIFEMFNVFGVARGGTIQESCGIGRQIRAVRGHV